MSKVTSQTINTSFPVPGKNNSSQGFRDNFAAIANNLEQTRQELSDLQSKVVVKSALVDSALDNNLAGTLLQNVQLAGHRYATFNLGSLLEGSVKIDVSRGELQIGALSGACNLVFARWPPAGTFARVIVVLDVSDPLTQTVTLPSNVTVESLDRVPGSNTSLLKVSCGYNQTSIALSFETVDCGDTITVKPAELSPKANQLYYRTPSSNGFPGDQRGDICFDASYLYVCQATYDSTIETKIAQSTAETTNKIVFPEIFNVSVNVPVIFSGTVFGGIVAGKPYYVKTVDSVNNAITISASRSNGTAGTTQTLTTSTGSMTATFYINGSAIWSRSALTLF